MIEAIERIVAECRKCSYVSKPFIDCGVYRLYKETKIKTLVISESPPPGNKNDFLYNLGHRDRLRKTLCKYFNLSEDELIAKFVEYGVLWDMAIRCRPIDRRFIDSMARNCSFVTQLVIESLKPKKLVLLGRTAQKQFEYVEDVLSYRPHTIVLEKHPLYVVRFEKSRVHEYFDRLKRMLFDD